jgi:NAD(P)-dependent dehydrogenase (short-subunit alcohol dehydrogenase family)
LPPLGAITEAHFDTTFGVNVKGTLFTVQKALPLLQDGSSIILDASANSVTGTPGLSVYSATKAAIRAFARSWILDLQPRHIRVNVVSPGPVNTPGLNEFVQDNEEIKANIAATVPLKRLGTPDDIAKAVSFLASDESSYINGIELFVDGGQTQI